MNLEELETEVMRECEFLSYYIEEYEKTLTTDRLNEALKELVQVMKEKHEKFDSLYNYIKQLRE